MRQSVFGGPPEPTESFAWMRFSPFNFKLSISRLLVLIQNIACVTTIYNWLKPDVKTLFLKNKKYALSCYQVIKQWQQHIKLILYWDMTATSFQITILWVVRERWIDFSWCCDGSKCFYLSLEAMERQKVRFQPGQLFNLSYPNIENTNLNITAAASANLILLTILFDPDRKTGPHGQDSAWNPFIRLCREEQCVGTPRVGRWKLGFLSYWAVGYLTVGYECRLLNHGRFLIKSGWWWRVVSHFIDDACIQKMTLRTDGLARSCPNPIPNLRRLSFLFAPGQKNLRWDYFPHSGISMHKTHSFHVHGIKRNCNNTSHHITSYHSRTRSCLCCAQVHTTYPAYLW